MATDLEKSRVTELYVRMDCNGCVQRIKKALHSTEGVYKVYVDLPQQKLTVIGRAEPEKLVKAIKKTRKTAIICSHTDASSPETPGTEPAAETADQPPTETPPVEANPQVEGAPPTEPPKETLPQENPASDAKPTPEAKQPQQTEPSKDVEQVHTVHEYPHSHLHRENWNNYPNTRHETVDEAPYYVTHSYNTHRPSSAHVTEYQYIQSPPSDDRYHVTEGYSDRYYQNQGGEGYYLNHGSDGNQITSMFSDENPNACRIV